MRKESDGIFWILLAAILITTAVVYWKHIAAALIMIVWQLSKLAP